MLVQGINPGDILLCDVRGDRFYALATVVPVGGRGAKVQIESLTRRPIPALAVTSRQIVGHWRKSKQSKV